jgi:hypothetical protein
MGSPLAPIRAGAVTRLVFATWCVLGAVVGGLLLLAAALTWGDAEDPSTIDVVPEGAEWVWILVAFGTLWTAGALVILALGASVEWLRARRGRPRERADRRVS